MKRRFKRIITGRRARSETVVAGTSTTGVRQDIIGATSQPNVEVAITRSTTQKEFPLSTDSDHSRTPDQDEYGVKILCSPEAPMVDIVFVHGLTGGQISTWTAEGTNAPWPRVLLSKDIPEARISTFGYDADVVKFLGQAGQNKIRQHAVNLLAGLADMRFDRGSTELPIIFVAHSLGGLVCENALTIATHAEQHQKSILDCTRAIAFLGTPHRGSDLASLATIAGNIIDLLKRTNIRILETLKPDSEVLEIITQEFHTMLRSRERDNGAFISITCYAEELPVSRSGKSFMVVPLPSATLERYAYKTIHSDHIEMTKFGERDDGYKKVSIELKRWIKDMALEPDSIWLPRLFGMVRQQRDRVANTLASLPQDSSLLSSITHTSPYEDFVRSGGVLWCSTQENLCPLVSSTIAAMIMQYLTGSRKDIHDTDTAAIYLEVPSIVKDKAYPCEFLDASHSCADPLHLLRMLIIQSFFSNSSTPTRLQSTIGKLPDSGHETLRKILRDPKSETMEMLLALLHSIMNVGNNPLVIAMDNANVAAQVEPNNLFKVLTDLPKRMHPTRSVHIIIGGMPKRALVEAMTEARIVDLNTEYLECLESLYFEGQHTRRDQIAIAHPATNGWIWTHPSYVAWKGDDSSILCIEGKPGSGKSVLAKQIQKELAEDQRKYTCDWFFSTRGRHTLMAHTSFMRSILYQLLQHSQSLFQYFQQTYRKYAPRSSLPWESLNGMQKILSDIIAAGSEVQCLIDAMDEAETGKDDSQTRRALLFTLSNLVANVERSHFKIIVLSRPFLDIELEFSRHRRLFGNLHRIVLQEENRGTIHTIVDAGIDSLRNAMHFFGSDYNLLHSLDSDAPRQLTNETSPSRKGIQRLKRLSQFQEKQKSREDSMLEKLRSYLLANAQGVTLWVTLILSILESHVKKGMYTFPELEQRLKSLPVKLDGLYRYCVDDLKLKFDKEGLARIRKTLMFVGGGNTLRPLKLEELWEALAIPQNLESALHSECDPIEEDRIHIVSWKEFRWQLHEMCGPLVEVISMETKTTRPAYGDDDVDAMNTVQLLHRTVKDFLANHDLAGPLSFNGGDAAKFVKDALHAYARIVMPAVATRYARLTTPEDNHWTQNIKNVVAYLGDKRLLPLIFDTLPNGPTEKCNLLGIFYPLLENSVLPPLASWSELELEWEFGPNLTASSDLDSAKSVISAYFVDYACTHGFGIAVQVLLEILSLISSDHLAYAVFDAALMVAIRHEMLNLIQALTKLGKNEPELRFWEETEYNVMGMPCYLNPFEMAAAQTGNEAVSVAVYDRNHRVSKKMPWDKWGFLSRGRKSWRRTPEDWNAFLEMTQEYKSSRQARESLEINDTEIGHVRAAIQLTVDYGKRHGYI